jgi:hypothetical protein
VGVQAGAPPTLQDPLSLAELHPGDTGQEVPVEALHYLVPEGTSFVYDYRTHGRAFRWAQALCALPTL